MRELCQTSGRSSSTEGVTAAVTTNAWIMYTVNT